MITYVQGQSNTVHGADSLAASFTSENTAGNLILVCLGAWNGGTSPTVSDNAGNTYTQIQTDTSEGSVVTIWYAQNIVGGANTVTVAGLSGADIDLIVAEYAGLLPTAGLVSAVAVNSGTTPSVTATAITPPQTADALLLYSYDQSNSGDTFTFTTSPTETFVQRETTSNTAGGECSALYDCIGSFSDTLTPSVAISAGSSRALYIVAIMIAANTASSTSGELLLQGAWSITSTAQTIESGFGASPVSFAATGLPSGITLDASTGTLSGAASDSGNYTFTVTATDANGKTASVTVTGSIVAPVDDTVCAVVIPGYYAYIG